MDQFITTSVESFINELSRVIFTFQKHYGN